MNSKVLDLENLIRGFRLSCQTEGKSPKTIEWYTSFLERFLQFLSSNGHPTGINQIDKDLIREFIRYLQLEAKTPHSGKPLSEATVQGYVRTLKSFFSWVIREDYLESNPMAKIPVPKAASKLVNTFSREQIARLFAVCHSSNGLGYRNVTILLLLLDSGIRVSELVSICLNDINLAEGYIKVRRGKGNKERLVPIARETRRELRWYLNHTRALLCPTESPYLFATLQGDPVSVNSIQQFIRRLTIRAGLGGVRCSPHIFRHTFATQALAHGANVIVLKDIMGHASLQTTQKYTHLQPRDLQSLHARFSPVTHLIARKSKKEM